MKIGNLAEASIREIWNSEKLQELRRSFSKGELPDRALSQPTLPDGSGKKCMIRMV